MTQNELDTLERNRRQIKRLLAQLITLSEPVGAVPITGIPSSGNGKTPVERIVVQKESLRAEIEVLQQESGRICFRIEPPRTRRVFLLFYAEGKTWQQIADEMGYADESTPRQLKIWYLKQQGLR